MTKNRALGRAHTTRFSLCGNAGPALRCAEEYHHRASPRVAHLWETGKGGHSPGPESHAFSGATPL